MIYWIRLLTFKEYLQHFVNGIALKIIRLSCYQESCMPVKEEIAEFIKEGNKITRRGKDICIHINKTKKYLIRPKTSDRSVFKQVIVGKEYEPMITFINEKNKANEIKNILDAGSNIGLTALFFHYHFPEAFIIAIEPEENNFVQLQKNIKINGIAGKVKLLKKALWKNNTDSLYISNNFRDGQGWAKSVIPQFNNQGKSVKNVTLQEIQALLSDEKFLDLVKIDIEGAEAALFGSDDFIQILQSSVKFLCLEIHDELNIREKVYKVFAEINFSYSVVGETCFCVNNNLVL